MSGPWEQYAAPAPAPAGPWTQYAGVPPAPPAPAAPAPRPVTAILHDAATHPIGPAEGAVGAVENALSMGTGLLGTVVGGLTGLVTGDPNKVGEVQQAMTYQPRSDAGKRQQELLQVVPRALHEVGQWLTSEPTKPVPVAGKFLPAGVSPGATMPPTDATQEQHPLLRAAAETAIETTAEHLPELLGARGLVGAYGGLRAADAAGTPVGPTLAETPGAIARAPGDAVAKLLTPKKPDPELLKTATMVQDKFPDIQVPPDRLQPPGASGRAATAQELGDLPGAGSSTADFENRVALSGHAIRLVDPENTAGRLTPEALGEGMDKAWQLIDKGYDEAGPQKAAALHNKLLPIVDEASRIGAGDVPRVITEQAKVLLGKADDTGQIPVDAVRNWDKDIGRDARTTADPSLARWLSNLQDVVREHVEGQVSPATRMDMAIGRKRYAMGVELQPIARAPGTINTGIMTDPRALLRSITDDRNGKIRTARGAGGDLEDLAKAGDLIAEPVSTGRMGFSERRVALEMAHALAQGVGAIGSGGVLPLLGRAYNARGPALTRQIIEANRPPAPPIVPPAAPTPILALPYDPNVSPSGGVANPGPLPVTGEGQAVLPETAQAQADLGTQQRVQGGTGAPPLATTFADHDLGVAGREPTPPAPEPPHPSGLPGFGQAIPGEPPSQLVQDPATFRHAQPRGAAIDTEGFPHDITEPDTARTMVAGPHHEVAADEATGRAMQSDNAALARRQQNAPAPEPAPAPAAHQPVPTPEEQAQLDHLDRAIAATQNPMAKAALQKARGDVAKAISARDVAEQAKVAAAELRVAAGNAPTPELAKTLNAQADKLDPPPKAPPAPPAAPAPKPPKKPKSPPPATSSRLLEPRQDLTDEADAARAQREANE